MMKKIVSLILLLALVLTLTPAVLARDAEVSSQALKIDGETVKSAAYNVDGYNFFRLRDLAYLLKDTPSRFAVEWDPAKGILLTTGESYEPIGGELASLEALTVEAQPSTDALWIDGREVAGVKAYKVAGNN